MSTVEVLNAEAVRLRALASKVEALAIELASLSHAAASPAGGGGDSTRPRHIAVPGDMSLSHLSQKEAIFTVLENGGAMGARAIYDKIREGGGRFKKASYVSTILTRMRQDGLVELKDGDWIAKYPRPEGTEHVGQ